MKSKNPKIQILKKGMILTLAMLFILSSSAMATEGLTLQGSSLLNQILYGQVGSTVKEIEEYFKANTTLYIVNEVQLRALAEYVNNGNDCTGKEIILFNDIRINSNEEWVPIGKSSETSFKGSFDGQNHTITGLTIKNKISYAGLFGYVEDATIKNVKTSEFKIDIPADIYTDASDLTDVEYLGEENITTTYRNAGNIVAAAKSSEILNCENRSNIAAGTTVGGIVGEATNTKVVNCKNYGGVSGFSSVGGVVGALIGGDQINDDQYSAIVENSSNYGRVQGEFNGIGGVVGEAVRNALIEGCYNKGSVGNNTDKVIVRASGRYVELEPGNTGGITGSISGFKSEGNNYNNVVIATVNGCKNDGVVSGYMEVGGLVGQVGSIRRGNALLMNSLNNGKVSSSDAVHYGNADKTKVSKLGYIAGLLWNSAESAETTTVGAVLNSYYIGSETKVEEEDTLKATNGENNYSNFLTKVKGVGENQAKNSSGIIWESDGKHFSNVSNTQNIDNLKDTKKIDTIKVLSSKDAEGYDLILATEDFNNDINGANKQYFGIKYSSENVFNYNNNELTVSDPENLNGTLDSTTGTTVQYRIYKNELDVTETEGIYFKSGDKIKIEANFNNKLYTSLGTSNIFITKTTAPNLKLKLGEDQILDMTIENVTDSGRMVTYTYNVVDETTNGQITNLELTTANTYYAIENQVPTNTDEFRNYKINAGTKLNSDVTGKKIYVDTVVPFVNTKVYVDTKLENGRYPEGKEIIVEMTTTEAVKPTDAPEIDVSFGESGLGKYNYNDDENIGNAKHVEAVINLDGTTTWKYSYIIEPGDEGNIALNYVFGEISDLAGNITNIDNLDNPEEGTSSNVPGSEWKDELGVTYEFYKNEVSEANKITTDTYFTPDDTLIVRATFDKVLYVHYGLSDGRNTNVRLNQQYKDRAPSLYLNEIKELKNTGVEAVELVEDATVVRYTFDMSTYKLKDLTQIGSLKLKNENNNDTITVNGTTVTTNGVIAFADEWYEDYSSDPEEQVYTLIGKDLTSTETELDYNIFMDPNKFSESITIDNIYADTTSPTVQIVPEGIENSLTNKSEINYKFTWSEEVTGFTAEDITVNNGTKEALSEAVKNEDGTYTYTMDITPNTALGDMGELQVIVEQDACTDLVGHSNVRVENVIKIDRQAPMLQTLEAYATSDVKLDDNLNDVKEYYKAGDKVSVVATFNEGLDPELLPKLVLQFSDSGNAKGTIDEAKLEGNKIIYTYTIAEGDKGTLSVKGFTGKVKDLAGNEATVAKTQLSGDAIIVDSEVATIESVTVIAPDFKYDDLLETPGDTKRYGEGTEMKVIVKFSEDIYNLTDDQISEITTETAPVLNLRFGDSETRNVKISSIDGDTLEYTYKVQPGDNGDLALVGITGTVSDMAGNIVTNPKLSKTDLYEDSVVEENKVDRITADTVKPVITISTTGVNKDDSKNTITGSEPYYRKGSIITIEVQTNEYVYQKEGNDNLAMFAESTAPKLDVTFGENTAKGSVNCTKVDYENGSATITYEYVIEENENGELSVTLGEKLVSDIALNVNSEEKFDSPIIADTVNPVTNWQSWIDNDKYGIVDNQDGNWEVTFSEKLYEYDPDTYTVGKELSNANKDSAPVLLVSNDNQTPLETTIVNIKTNEDGKTVIRYSYAPYTKNTGAYGMKFANVSDKAGNLFNYKDQQAPTLSNIKITTPEDKSGAYCAGTEVTIVATFSEKISGTAPTLKVKFGEGEEKILSSGIIKDNTITYTYTIQEGDNGELVITAFEGTELTDLYDNAWVRPEEVPAIKDGTIVADTTKPTVTIKAYKNYDTENKEEISGKTNAEMITYEFTWSEDVVDFTADDINVTNGTKDIFRKINNKVYTLDIITSNEGRQTITIPSGVCTDTAKVNGNPNEGQRYNLVEIDNTAPKVRFVTPNGGIYTVATDSGTANLYSRIEIDENVETLKYRVVETGKEPEEYSVKEDINSSDIDITMKNVSKGEYTVEVIAIDEAGNELHATSNQYIVTEGKITITPNTTDPTNQDVIVTIAYDEALTENRKAGVQGKTLSADSAKVIVTENGTVYAEATDIAGNKVYATLDIKNIDKTDLKAIIEYTTNEDGSVTATISFNEEAKVTNNDGKTTYTFIKNGEFTFEFEDAFGNKGTATAKVTTIEEKPEEDETAPEITFNYTTTIATVGTPIGAVITTNEDAIISYSWDNKNWTSSNGYVRSQKATRTPTVAGTYTLYAKAIDRSSNESKVSTVKFTVVDSESEIKVPEVIFEDLITIQKNEIKYVKVPTTFTTEELTSKMDKDALLGYEAQYEKLTSDNELRTGSEITVDGNLKYIVIVNGDVNCDGKVDFLGDVVMINNYRIGAANLKDVQILAGDINNSGSIEFIPDIVAMNNYRLGRIDVL